MKLSSCAVSVLLLLGLAGLLSGCGGANHARSAGDTSVASASLGRARITIAWPERKITRLIPSAASSIQVVLLRGDATIATQLVTRPDNGRSIVMFENLPVDTVTVQATAYPNADGTGVAQATGTTTTAVRASDTTVFTLSLGSTIDHVELDQSSLLLATGTTQPLTVTAKATDGSVVLTTPQQFAWSGSGDAFSVDSTGLVLAKVSGSGTLTVTDTESGKAVSIPISVFQPIAVVFDPNTAKVSVRKTLQLTVNVTGDGAKDVTWKVEEDGGGSVSATGLYAAPTLPGTYHVVATSVADTTKSDRLTITVVAGSAGGTIN